MPIENRPSKTDQRLRPEYRTSIPAVFLMYHELQSLGRELCQSEPGYVRYVIRESEFRVQLALLADQGYRGLSVSEGLAVGSSAPAVADGSSEKGLRRGSSATAVVFTFDDGCETDLLIAAPLLKDRAFGATFFLVPGFLGRCGYLTKEQARELANSKFEIGCHSMTHAYLTGLAGAALGTEIVDAKDRLEQIVGQRVDHFSCPGGRWSNEVARVAREADYRSVSTSRIGVNAPYSNPYCLNRVAVLRGVSNFLEICQGKGLGVLRLRQAMRSAVRSSLGDSVYDRLRGALLHFRS